MGFGGLTGEITRFSVENSTLQIGKLKIIGKKIEDQKLQKENVKMIENYLN